MSRSSVVLTLLLACGSAPPGAADAPVRAAAEPESEPEPESASGSEPESESESESESVSEAAPRFGHADVDPANDHQVGPPDPLPDCEERLASAGVTFVRARIGVGRKRDGVYTCGAEQVVRYRSGPGDIRYDKAPLLTCGMALALADFERVVQEDAERILGTRVTRIDHLGTYNCREMAAYDLISEHSFANGIDLRRFHLADRSSVGVLEHFRPKETEPNDPKTLFLRSVANRLYDENVFSVVVTPYFDRFHRNHIHVDLARYRVDGTRP